MNTLELLVTLWPSFKHFPRFAHDSRLSGIRLNSAMMSSPELNEELERIEACKPEVPLFFDVKGRQPRVIQVHDNPDYLDITLNHPIRVEQNGDSLVVLFKAGADHAVLDRIEEDGKRLVFLPGCEYGPKFKVRPGESLHVRHPSFRIAGPLFTEEEVKKVERVRQFGMQRYFLSYVEEQADIDQFLELVGKDAEVWLKIETQRGLQFVAEEFQAADNLRLVAARGDLYIEIARPHQILEALALIIEQDPEACVGSRLLLSVVSEPVPACADFCELAWLYDIGYRSMLLCDELCLKEELLAPAINAFQSFRDTYAAVRGI